jgi:hypothetical protein
LLGQPGGAPTKLPLNTRISEERCNCNASVPFPKFLFMWELHVESAAAEAFDGFEDVVS